MRVRERAYGVACASAVFQPFRRKDFSSSFFPPPPLLPFFLPFVSHAAEFPRSPIRTITVTPRTPRFVISSSPLPNYLSTVQTDLFDTNRGHNRRPSAVLLGSARIIRSFHERYRVVVKSTRPVLITTHRSIPQLRSFFLSIPLRSTIFFQPSRRVFLFHFSRLFRSSRPDRTLNLERGSIGANYSSPTPLDSALMSHHHHHHRRRRSNLLPGKYPLNLARAVRWQLR